MVIKCKCSVISYQSLVATEFQNANEDTLYKTGDLV